MMLFVFITTSILLYATPLRTPMVSMPTVQVIINDTAAPYLIVLGNVQDGGAPHPGCEKACCKGLFEHPDPTLKVVSLGLIDPQNGKRYLFEATPDLPAQMHQLMHTGDFDSGRAPDGIFLTHAHIGHYTGLMYLGKEAMETHDVPVYAMPRMRTFLRNNGPWSQLVAQENISLVALTQDSSIHLSGQLRITPFLVPHRDEYSETVGFLIEGPHMKVLFIPDIDKWQQWDRVDHRRHQKCGLRIYRWYVLRRFRNKLPGHLRDSPPFHY